VGEREQYMADRIAELVKQRVDGIPAFFSDGLKFYDRKVNFRRTGKRGRPRIPAVLLSGDLHYAQIIRQRENGHLVSVERKMIFGQSEDGLRISTSHVERCNLTLRQENKRLARKTLAFSKRQVRPHAHLTLYLASYNFCRPHRSLTHLDAAKKKRRWTPAMQLGIVDHVWSLKELLTFLYHKTSVC
jgi:hypothetical protein